MQEVAQVLEAFFGGRFSDDGFIVPGMAELRFESANMKYRILLTSESDLHISADPVNSDLAFPAFEIGCKCRFCLRTELSGGIPALFFYSTETENTNGLRLVITKHSNPETYSIAPCLPYEPPDTGSKVAGS
jgi:hypothetical protein